MEILNTILIVIGFASLGWYIKILKAEIKTQKNSIDTQSKILSDAKAFMDMYDINKLKEFVAVREETIELQKNNEIREIKNKIDKKDKTVKILDEWCDDLLELCIRLIFDVPSIVSIEALNKMPDSKTKERFRKIIADKEKMEITPKGLGLNAAGLLQYHSSQKTSECTTVK